VAAIADDENMTLLVQNGVETDPAVKGARLSSRYVAVSVQ
jgi:hypothetical protein